MYDCFSNKDKEDKEMEPEPSEAPTGPSCPLLQKVAREIRNEEKQAQNENRRRARAERRTRRKKKQVIKEVEEAIKETKEALKHTKAAAKSNKRTTQPRRLPRLNPIETAGRADESMNLGANMHSA